jgi:hypothetical protein
MSTLVPMADEREHHPSAPALRDALGLVRLLYAATRDEERRDSLVKAGESLAHALAMSDKPPETLGFKSVAFNAESAFGLLGKMSLSPEVAALVEVAQARVKAGQARAYELEARAARSQQH